MQIESLPHAGSCIRGASVNRCSLAHGAVHRRGPYVLEPTRCSGCRCRSSRRSRPCSASAAVASKPSAALQSAELNVDEVAPSYKRLQNGSDVRGIAIAGYAAAGNASAESRWEECFLRMDGACCYQYGSFSVPGEEQNLTPSIGFSIGAGFAEWLSQRTGKPLDQLRISIGRDSRLSGPLLASSMAAGIASRGARVAQFGLATTPAMFMSCIIEGFQYDGAIIITASHLPFNRNGFKFFTEEGGLEKGDIADLLAHAAKSSAGAGVHPAARHTDDAHLVATALEIQPDMLEQVDFMPVYADHLRKIIKHGVSRKDNPEKPLEGFKIAVDPGNGGGGFFATDVLAPLGADVSGSQFLDPDGWFPNHVPNPEDKTAMAAGVDAVLRSHSDLGVVLDTDVDRSAVVSRDGQAIAQNRYIALMSVITLRKYPGTTIVTDSVTSNGLTAFIESLGGKHFRYRRGYKNVIGKGMELNKSGTDAALMMETSGHGAVKENYFLDDGAYSAVQIIIEVVRRKLAGEADIMEQLLKELREPVESQEFRLKITVRDFKPVGDQVLGKFHDWVARGADGASNWHLETENHEGWRVAVDEGDGKKGWLLLRSSLHDPLLVLNVESDLPGGARKTVLHLRKFFAANGDLPLDTSRLQDVVAAQR